MGKIPNNAKVVLMLVFTYIPLLVAGGFGVALFYQPDWRIKLVGVCIAVVVVAMINPWIQLVERALNQLFKDRESS